MKNLAKVSIIIPVYNGSNYLSDAIDSALAQTYNNCEVLVVNDGSTDGGKTESIAKSYGDRIRYYSKPNGGVATAINLGIRNMNGDYFAWLSHDDLFKPDKIEKQMKALEEMDNNKFSSVFGNFVFWNMGDNNYSLFDMEEYCDCTKILKGVYPVLFGLIHFSTMLVSRKRIDEVGMCDEKLKTTQDIEWAFRILRDTESVFIKEPLTVVRRHPEQGKYHIKEYDAEQGKTHVDFLKQISEDEIEDLFVNKTRFLLQMMSFYKKDGNMVAYNYAKDELLNSTCEEELNNSFSMAEKRLFKSAGGKDICIFGAGRYGKLMLEELLLRGIHVRCFVDNDSEKWGKKIEGFDCISPDLIREDDLLIIAVKQYESVLKEIRHEHVLTYKEVTTLFEDII